MTQTPRRVASETPTRRLLPNGLKLLALHTPHARRAVLHAQLTVGSRFESQELNGISHFLEHMIYRGTESYPSAHEQALAFERYGGTLVAATATDMGSMSIGLPMENLAPVLPILAEVFTSPRFDGIDIERGIVSEEILEGLDDDGRSVDADDLIRDLVFDGHPLGMPITGTLEHLKRFDVPRLRAHHAQFYHASNTTLVVASPQEPESVLEALTAAFSVLPSGQAPSVEPPPQQDGARFRYVPHSASQTQLRVGFRAPSDAHPDEPAMEILLRVLDDGMSARLYHRICDELGLCYDVSASYETYSDSGLVEISAESSHERAHSVLVELLGVVADLRSAGPTDVELERAKQRYDWQLDMMHDSADELVEFIALMEQTGRGVEASSRRAQLMAVTREQVREVAGRWFVGSQLSVVAVGVQKKAQRSALMRLVESFG